ncbi:MAG: oligosaccharide flippase family protein [Nitrososphaerota archaeon]|nr:oligosaccharide flippase family protein [Nitrososphaerota archaeon]MDG7014928.1 oligosaccharide flippase family protein [Nitrososphaerota archaeon]WGO51056.1 MAG: oligosaccharide flippase family protein [Nitrososphaerota archaeon]
MWNGLSFNSGSSPARLCLVRLSSPLRFLPSYFYGAYSAVQVAVDLASILTTLGLGFVLVKFLAPDSAEPASPGWGTAKATILLNALIAFCFRGCGGPNPLFHGLFSEGGLVRLGLLPRRPLAACNLSLESCRLPLRG